MSPAPNVQSSLLVGMHTDPGRSGKNNEDAFDVFVVDWQPNASTVQSVHVAVVADGIGGNNAGERASRIAVERIRSVMTVERTMPIPQRLEKALIAANQDIFVASQYNPALQGMGTTVVVAAITNSTLHVVHAGDSRAYLIRGNSIHQLTLDHTWAQEAIEAGRLTPEAARLHPNRNVIKRFLGIEETISVDHTLIDINAPPRKDNPFVVGSKVDKLGLQPGDRILLCSDGLSDELTDDEILAGARKDVPQKAAERLVAMANAKGGRDNITVVLLELPAPQKPKTVVAVAQPAVFILVAVLLLGLGVVAGWLWFGRGQEDVSESVSRTSPVAEAKVTGSTSPVLGTSPIIVTPTSPFAGGNQLTSPTPLPISPPVVEATPFATATPVSIARATPTSPERSPERTLPSGNTTPTRPSGRSALTPVINLTVRLLEPPPGDSGNGLRTFAWEVVSGALMPGQAMELMFWLPDKDPLQDGRALVSSSPTATRATVDLNALSPGTYYWGVLLVELQPSYRRLQLVSESRLFTRVESSRAVPPPQPTTPTPPPTPTPTLPPTPTPTLPPTPTPTLPPTPTPTLPPTSTPTPPPTSTPTPPP